MGVGDCVLERVGVGLSLAGPTVGLGLGEGVVEPVPVPVGLGRVEAEGERLVVRLGSWPEPVAVEEVEGEGGSVPEAEGAGLGDAGMMEGAAVAVEAPEDTPVAAAERVGTEASAEAEMERLWVGLLVLLWVRLGLAEERTEVEGVRERLRAELALRDTLVREGVPLARAEGVADGHLDRDTLVLGEALSLGVKVRVPLFAGEVVRLPVRRAVGETDVVK